MRAALAFGLMCFMVAQGWAETPQNEVRAAITAFSDGLHDRNIAHVQKTVGNDVVAFLDGTRYDGWEMLRDRGLIPDFSHAAAPGTWQIVNLSATGDMAWAYTKTSASGKSRAAITVWTVFVLEKRGKEWKIVLIDRAPGRDASLGKPNRRR